MSGELTPEEQQALFTMGYMQAIYEPDLICPFLQLTDRERHDAFYVGWCTAPPQNKLSPMWRKRDA